MSSSAAVPTPPPPRRREGAEPGPGLGEPGSEDPGSDAGSNDAPIVVRQSIDDRWLVALLVPGFGIGIAHGTSLFGPLGPADGAWWWGHAWFIGGAGLIYGANRTLLFAGRAHADWFSRPVARLALLAAGIVFGTVPTTALMLHFWSALSGVPLAGQGVTVLLVNIICVLFTTWLYETLFLIRERVDDQVRLHRVRAARDRAELDLLRAQVSPHFLFNALNTLTALIETRPATASAFVAHLARIYRSTLDTRKRPVVSLAEELELAAAYAALAQIRYGDAVAITIHTPCHPENWWIPPCASQVLLENAIRHNAIDPDAPLHIDVHTHLPPDAPHPTLTIAHPHRPRPGTAGAGTGLANLDARARAATGRPLHVTTGATYRVSVPLLAAPAYPRGA